LNGSANHFRAIAGDIESAALCIAQESDVAVLSKARCFG
jgi:hypothetical protein